MELEQGYHPRDDARIERTDRRFTERFDRLKDRYGDPFAIPRDKFYALQQWRAEQYAIAHGRDPRTRERVYVPKTRKPRPPKQREIMASVKAMMQG